jgi:hypothetical protein
MFRRPVPGESEDDLLRIQQEFQKSKTGPSVSVLRKPSSRVPETNAAVPSSKSVKFAGDAPLLGMSFCRDIVEKESSPGVPPPGPKPVASGFPEVFRVDAGAKVKKGGKSLFAQQMAKKRAVKAEENDTDTAMELGQFYVFVDLIKQLWCFSITLEVRRSRNEMILKISKIWEEK